MRTKRKEEMPRSGCRNGVFPRTLGASQNDLMIDFIVFNE